MVQMTRSRGNAGKKLTPLHIFLTIFLCGVSFYTGTLSDKCHANGKTGEVNERNIDAIVQERLKAEVLLFYNNDKALPSKEEYKRQVQYDNGSGVGLLDVESATENCDTMNVINTNNPGNTRQCFAIVGNYESYHVQRWMRVPLEKGKVDPKEPLRAVSRGYDKNGAQQFVPPSEKDIVKHWGILKTYFEGYEENMAELKSVAEKVAIKNTVIVMTCNMGQSELLMNFVCNAKAKGLDVSNVLVFPTDQETQDLAEGLGLATFYDKKNFGDMPSGEAKHYGDKAFVAMMFAKDVDVVWYKNPLEYFHDPTNEFRDFDMYFQDDGAHTTRYAPLSANSGFYYVRNNQRTRYLFTSLLYNGDQILTSHSHQEALVQLMNEHSSLFGLRVKVLSRDMDEFPGGWHYHRHSKDYMIKVVKEEITPIIFHMSWTKNKDNKLKFFQQMGQWYTNDACIAHTKNDIMGNHDMAEGDSLLEPCCLAEPNIVCHYRDKPSKIPCRDVDPIDEGRPSFW
eukprot:scaffold493_cov258-Chaetoceros_neogracile.AAC.8